MHTMTFQLLEILGSKLQTAFYAPESLFSTQRRDVAHHPELAPKARGAGLLSTCAATMRYFHTRRGRFTGHSFCYVGFLYCFLLSELRIMLLPLRFCGVMSSCRHGMIMVSDTTTTSCDTVHGASRFWPPPEGTTHTVLSDLLRTHGAFGASARCSRRSTNSSVSWPRRRGAKKDATSDRN